MTFSTLGTMASYVPKQGVTGTVDLSTATVVKGAGMDLITPTSVAGSGVTLSGGKITFTAATSVSVNGCFTAAYDNYRIVAEGVNNPGGIVILRLRLSGTDASGADYNYQLLNGQVSTPATGSVAAATGFDYFMVGNTTLMVAEGVIRRPNLAQTTMLTSQGGRADYLGLITGYHNTTTQYDGFSLIVGTGNATGTLRVYGMRNS